MGLLKAIVIDEAHLVESWGTGFRSEFQMLSGVRRELLSTCPHDKRTRTVLLSATMTQSTLNTLKRVASRTLVHPVSSHPCLYGRRSNSRIGDFSFEGARRTHIIEAMAHVPRPAILYVTKVADAEDWFERLHK